MNANFAKSPVLKIPVKVDANRVFSVLKEAGVFDLFRQDETTLSLVNRGVDEDPWRSGTTARLIPEQDEFPFSEGEFKFINKPLQNTYFSHCYQQAQEVLNNRAGRVRLFRRVVQTTSSLHQDLDIRLHLALKTNPGAFLIFPEHGLFQIPADGHFYLVDTTRPHFAVNTNGQEDRLHLIFDSFCGFREKRSMESQILESNQLLFDEIYNRPGVQEC